jgi:hypothetical protein
MYRTTHARSCCCFQGDIQRENEWLHTTKQIKEKELELELELELTQTHMTQKPLLWVEVARASEVGGARVPRVGV